MKVSLATTLNRSKGGQLIAHVKAMPGNPYDGHTLATVLPEMEAQIGVNLARNVADRGYRGDNSAPEDRLEGYISGQKRAVMDAITRDLRRRFLSRQRGDAANAVLAAAGYNFRRLLAWLRRNARVLFALWLMVTLTDPALAMEVE